MTFYGTVIVVLALLLVGLISYSFGGNKGHCIGLKEGLEGGDQQLWDDCVKFSLRQGHSPSGAVDRANMILDRRQQRFPR